ncbi:MULTISPECIES: hypothetical protein [Paenibacillus]|uniref:Uncharacterized protein n=1 Tax=Paenibacillus pabuli TaxID=1472 RepID=A0A855XQ80_9BACL|nr:MULTISPECIES: hypothetical protein [Paenibacillus]PWW32924.1 hypothetical protein DET56_12260 [Paenibacillus pabuli]PXV98807.1 hypothetical protein DEU73_12060 [Paenibacillus taichungensis]
MYLDRLQLFIQSGQYTELKKLENELSCLRDRIMKYQEIAGLERIVWRKQGVVGYFTRVHLYEEDKAALFDFFHNSGLLPYVVNVQWAKLLPDEQLKLEELVAKREGYVRFWPKKTKFLFAKESNYDLAKPLQADILDLVSEWRVLKWKYERVEKQWTTLRREALREWGERERKIQLPSGSLSVVRLKPQIQAGTLLKHLDRSALLRAGTVNYDKVIEFAAKGYFNKVDVDKYRKIKDISIRYILMELQNEIKKHEYFNRRLNCLSEMSRQM